MAASRKKNHPFIQIYIKDWLADSRLKYCSYAEKGFLFELICQMHQSDDYGFVMYGDKYATYNEIIQAFSGNGQDETFIRKLFDNLITLGVITCDKKERYCSNRMIIDEKKRATNVDNGKKGGNPDLIKKKIKDSIIPVSGVLETRTINSENSKVERGSFIFNAGKKRFIVDALEMKLISDEYINFNVQHEFKYIQNKYFTENKNNLSGTSTNIGVFLKTWLDNKENKIKENAVAIIPLIENKNIVISHFMVSSWLKKYTLNSTDIHDQIVYCKNKINKESVLNKEDTLNLIHEELRKLEKSKKSTNKFSHKTEVKKSLSTEESRDAVKDLLKTGFEMGYYEDHDFNDIFADISSESEDIIESEESLTLEVE